MAVRINEAELLKYLKGIGMDSMQVCQVEQAPNIAAPPQDRTTTPNLAISPNVVVVVVVRVGQALRRLYKARLWGTGRRDNLRPSVLA